MRHFLAKLFGSFHTDCPHCHGHFYGLQGYKTNVKIDKHHYRVICMKCAKKHLKAKQPSTEVKEG